MCVCFYAYVFVVVQLQIEECVCACVCESVALVEDCKNLSLNEEENLVLITYNRRRRRRIKTWCQSLLRGEHNSRPRSTGAEGGSFFVLLME